MSNDNSPGEAEQLEEEIWGGPAPEECPVCKEEYVGAFRLQRVGQVVEGKLCYYEGVHVVHDAPLVLEGSETVINDGVIETPDEGYMFEIPSQQS